MTASITPGTGKFSWKESGGKVGKRRGKEEERETMNAPAPIVQGGEVPGWVGTGNSDSFPSTSSMNPPSPSISTSSGRSVTTSNLNTPTVVVRKIEPKPRVAPKPVVTPIVSFLEPGEILEEDNEEESSPRRSRRRRSEESLQEDGEKRPRFARSDSNGQNGGGHQCDKCGKVYKHRNCLVKHGWEHHESWALTKKWCQTKHQQVQMLEAAQVLVEMTKMPFDTLDLSSVSSLTITSLPSK